MKYYRKYQLKGEILECIDKGINTSRGIYESVGHPSYPAFRSELYSLKRRGYISIDKSSRHNTYVLTKIGKKHNADPYINLRHKQENIHRRVSAILNEDERFKAAVQEEVINRLPGISSPSSCFSSPQSENPHAENVHLLEELKNKDGEIIKLQNRIRELTQPKTATCQRDAPKPKTPEEQKQEQERMQRRQKIAQAYASRRHMLDFNFFKSWGDMWPYRMKHLQLYKIGSVEILGMSNPEHGRGHTRGMLDEGGIIGAGFFIMQIRKDGIVVCGKGMSEDKLLRW